MSRGIRALLVLGVICSILNDARAAFVADFSPDTTGVVASTTSFTNEYGSQILGDTFTLSSDTVITAASIFSSSSYGAVGDSARVLIFADNSGTPSGTALVDLTVTIDAVDTLYTSIDSRMSRKHASFGPITLQVGTYWFSMSGDGGANLTQALALSSATFADAKSRYGLTSLNNQLFSDMFFQLEGGAVPEPSTLTLFTPGAFTVLGGRLRKKRQRS